MQYYIFDFNRFHSTAAKELLSWYPHNIITYLYMMGKLAYFTNGAQLLIIVDNNNHSVTIVQSVCS